MGPRRQRHGPPGAGLPIGRASRSRSPCGPPPRDVHASPQDRQPRIGTLKCSRRSAVRGPGSTRTSIRFVPGPPGRAARFQAGPTRLLPGSARRIVIGEEVVFKPGFVSCTRRWPRCCTITPHGFTTSTEERAAFRQRDLHRRAQRTVAAPRVEGAPCCRRQRDRASNRRLRRQRGNWPSNCRSPRRSLWPLKKKLPRLLKRYPVTLVHPIAEDRCIVKLATDPDVPAQVAEPRLALRGASIVGKRLPASRPRVFPAEDSRCGGPS